MSAANFNAVGIASCSLQIVGQKPCKHLPCLSAGYTRIISPPNMFHLYNR